MIKVCAKLKVFTVKLKDRYYIYQFSTAIIERAGPLARLIIIFLV